MKSAKGRAPAESAVTTTHLVLPSHTNALGTIFGGTVMSWIDIAAAIAAGKHARKAVVTASIDALHFSAPIRLGDVVHIQAMVNHAGRTSMEVGVRVDAENPRTGELRRTVTAYTTFVAIGDDGRPTGIPPLLPATQEEKRRSDAAQRRRETRVKLAAELKARKDSET